MRDHISRTPRQIPVGHIPHRWGGKPNVGPIPCRICGVPTKKPKGHYRCVALVANRKRYAKRMAEARHMAQVAGEYVRARL